MEKHGYPSLTLSDIKYLRVLLCIGRSLEITFTVPLQAVLNAVYFQIFCHLQIILFSGGHCTCRGAKWSCLVVDTVPVVVLNGPV